MGAPRHRRHGVHGDRPHGNSARSDRSSGADVRRVRAGTRALRRFAARSLFVALAIAFGRGTSAAQQVPPKPPSADSAKALGVARSDSAGKDSTGKDSTRKDSTARAKPLTREDTIKAPFPRPYAPLALDLATGRSHWDRDSLYATGALTVGELLAQVPGVTFYTTGFLLAPQVAGWNGDVGRVRVFIDGVERDVLNRRNGGVPDFATIPLWSLEDVLIERAPGELRVHLRTWRVERTTASTRTDVLTGSESLNLYRWDFGKRAANGFGIQFAGQQFSTSSVGGMDGDALGLFARLGWARGSFSTDATFLRQGINRNVGDRFLATTPVLNSMPAWRGGESQTSLRLAWHDPMENGPWVQLIAATSGSSVENSTLTTTAGTGVLAPSDTGPPLDTAWTRSQYSLAGGINRGAVHVSAGARMRSIAHQSIVSPSARAEYDGSRLGVSVFLEKGVDSLVRGDVRARFAPVNWFAVGGGVGRESARKGSGADAFTSMRAEASLHVASAWLSGGLMSRSASAVTAPIEIDTTAVAATIPASTGFTAALRTSVWRGWNLDVDYVSWATAVAYRPQRQMRSRLWFSSSFLEAFPRSNFHVDAALIQEYRGALYLPAGAGKLTESTQSANVYSSLLEVRIGTAILSWSYRNLTGHVYETWPGYVMPRLTSVYGVRWEFWN